MNNKQILTKALEKAVKNGFDMIEFGKWFYEEEDCEDLANTLIIFHTINVLIFSHDFAKAFWGEELIPVEGGHETIEVNLEQAMEAEVAYKHHIQQMVLEKNPLKYIEKFL